MDELIDLPLVDLDLPPDFQYPLLPSSTIAATSQQFVSAEVPSSYFGDDDAIPEDIRHRLTDLTEDQDHEPQLRVKRKRRVLGPVMGNNRTGTTGKFTCTHCRLRRSRCVYDDVSQPCQFCTTRKLVCLKVLGPKAAMRKGAVTFCSTLASNTFRQMSLIRDTNLTDEENMYLGWYYERFWAQKTFDFRSIVLQHLWTVCGLTTPNQSLLYATLCVTRHSYQELVERKTGSEIQIDPHFMSRFLAGLRDAIRKDEITECHLFAVGLITSLSWRLEEEFNIHFTGFIDMLNCLLCRRRSFQSQSLSLPWLYPFMLHHLSALALLLYPGEGMLYPESLLLTFKGFATLARMEIPSVGSTDDRSLYWLPIKFWSAVQLQRSFIWRDISHLFWAFGARFRMELTLHLEYYHHLKLGLRGLEASDLLNGMALDLEKVLMLPFVQEFLKCLNSDEGGLEYIRNELDKGTAPDLSPWITLFYAWGSVTLLLHLRKQPRAIGSLPLLSTMRRVVQIFVDFPEPVSHVWLKYCLATFSTLISPAFSGYCEGAEANELRVQIQYMVAQYKDARFREYYSQQRPLWRIQELGDRGSDFAGGNERDYEMDAAISEGFCLVIGSYLDKLQVLCECTTRGAVIEFLKENVKQL